jgi:hypothetical protein
LNKRHLAFTSFTLAAETTITTTTTLTTTNTGNGNCDDKNNFSSIDRKRWRQSIIAKILARQRPTTTHSFYYERHKKSEA